MIWSSQWERCSEQVKWCFNMHWFSVIRLNQISESESTVYIHSFKSFESGSKKKILFRNCIQHGWITLIKCDSKDIYICYNFLLSVPQTFLKKQYMFLELQINIYE